MLTAGGDARVALTTLELAMAMAWRGAMAVRADGHLRRPRGLADTDPALRQDRRRALRRDLGVHQVDARQRSRRGRLLARPHDQRRRGPQVHRSAHAHLRIRGRRQRRPAGAAHRARRVQGRRVHRLARGAHQSRASGHIPRARTQEQCRLRRPSTPRSPRSGRVLRAPCPTTCAIATVRVQRAYGPYRYPHDSPDAVVEQRYLPDGLECGTFFSPSAHADGKRTPVAARRNPKRASPGRRATP